MNTQPVITQHWWDSFWFTGFVLALIVNILSAYLKPYFDRWLENFSIRQKNKNKKAEEKLNKRVEGLLADSTDVIGWSLLFIQHEIVFFTALILFCVLLEGTGSFVSRIFMGIIIIVGVMFLMKMGDTAEVLQEYRRRKRAQRDNERNAVADDSAK